MDFAMTAESNHLYERLLVVRCQAGDEQAFAEIIRTYDQRLRYFLLKLLADRHAAEDAAQDVWLDVYRGLVRLREPEAFRAWLYRLARDRAFRKLRQTRPVQTLVETSDIPSTEESDEEVSAEDAKRIHAAPHTLSPEPRQTLLLPLLS